MSTPNDAAQRVPNHSLPIRACRIYAEQGKSVSTHIHCPRLDAVRDVNDCMACGSYCGVSFAVIDGATEANLLCREEPRGVRAAANDNREDDAPSFADRTPVWAIMRSDVYCIRRDVGITRAMSILLEAGIGGLPVVDEDGFPEGMLSKTDLVRWMWETGASPGVQTKVADLMTPLAFTLPAEVMISHAAALMAVEGVHRLPIVATSGKVIGIVSALDVVRFLAKHDGYLPRG